MPAWVILPGEDDGESTSLLQADTGSSQAKQEAGDCPSEDAGLSRYVVSQRGLVKQVTTQFRSMQGVNPVRHFLQERSKVAEAEAH